MSSNTNNEGEIRKAIIEADLVECMVALPGQFFTNTQIPACIWFLTRNKSGSTSPAGITSDLAGAVSQPSRMASSSIRGVGVRERSRKNQTLFIDARNLGYMKDRVLRDFAPEDIRKIADTFHAWKQNPPQSPFSKGGGNIPPFEKGGLGGIYEDIPGFCKSAVLNDIRKHDYVLTPGRYVGAAEQEADGEPFEEKMARLTATLNEQFAESAKLETAIRENLTRLGYGL